MIVELLPAGSLTPIQLEASQIVIRLSNGTPIGLAGVVGQNEVEFVHANDKNFNSTLARYGIPPVQCDRYTAKPQRS